MSIPSYARSNFQTLLRAAGQAGARHLALPLDVLRQAPLSNVDEKPMKRASAAQLRQILAEEDISLYERG